jgi:ribosomal protein S18 acetylase RimI-like enzyme
VPNPKTPEKLRRERAGTYVTADGRFSVEQSSSGWLLLDAEQANELGLRLARGPYATLDEARAALADARSGPAPKADVVDLAGRIPKAERGDRPPKPTRPRQAKRPEKPRVVFREFRAVDGDQLRKLWADCGFRSLGDDDLSLARLARRNPGLLRVASEGTQIVGSALGAWDGRRGWIYHVATAQSHRRQGIASRLVDQVEAGLRDLGCPKVSVLVRDENDDGTEFWVARGYDRGSRQYARELSRD